MAKIPKLGRVLAREDYKGGEHYVTVEWVDEENYCVVGSFKLFGWAQPPRALGEKVMKIPSKPPKVLYHSGPRGRAGSR
jgi:hypothetical protein